MDKFRIERFNQLPAELQPSTMYIIKAADAEHAEVILTGNDSQPRRLINQADVQVMITTALSNAVNQLLVVASIAERDALTLVKNTMVLVLDATGDSTVNSGSALYIWDVVSSRYYKVAEYESMDVILSWTNIQGKPSSSPAAIDDAVSKSHVHQNSSVLDQLGETPDSLLTYNNELVTNYLAVSEW